MSHCTWTGCTAPATHPQLGRGGKQWADLCAVHAAEIEASGTSVKGMLAAWVKAQGGPKRAAERM